MKKLCQWLKTPAGRRSTTGGILLVGFISGIIFWGGFNTGLEMTNTEEFCISCHEMEDNVYGEYQQTIHYTNRSGVRATCPDCHVPKEWTPKMIRKIQASRELYGKVMGTVDTPEKFAEHRAVMAQREWKRIKKTIRKNAVIVMNSLSWTLPCKVIVHQAPMKRPLSKDKLVLTAIRVLPINYLIWRKLTRLIARTLMQAQ